MRSNLRILALGLLVAFTAGCESTRWNWLKRDPQDSVAKAGTAPSVAGLVHYLNDNAGRVRTLKVDEAAIDTSFENQTFSVRGRLFAAKPRNFRMKVMVVGKDELDIGSNPQEFWFWAAKNKDPYQYFCAYKDVDAGNIQGMPLPVQPEWVMEALGLGPYSSPEKYQLEADAKTIRLIEKTKSPLGSPIRKVIVMQRQPVKSPQPQVTDFLLVDDRTGQEICSAQVESTKVDRATGAILPYKMTLSVPSQRMKMVLRLDGLTVNEQIEPTVFVRQPMTGVDPYNLATGRTESWGVQATQGIGPR